MSWTSAELARRFRRAENVGDLTHRKALDLHQPKGGALGLRKMLHLSLQLVGKSRRIELVVRPRAGCEVHHGRERKEALVALHATATVQEDAACNGKSPREGVGSRP